MRRPHEVEIAVDGLAALLEPVLVMVLGEQKL